MSFKAGDLAAHLAAWRAIGSSSQVLNWIKHGVPLNISGVNFSGPQVFPNQVRFGPQALFVKQELQDLVSCGALRPISSIPTVVSALKTVPKKGEIKYRLITDLRFVNQFCHVPKFSNEDIRTVLDIIEPSDRMITLDLKSAFQHIRITPSDQSMLGVCFRGKYYVWQVLPFGANVSPYYCYKILRAVVQYLRRKGLRVVLYVDDLILCAPPEDIVRQRDFLLQTLKSLGLYINFEKSVLDPSQSVTFIGYRVSTTEVHPRIEIPQARIRKLKKDVRRALNSVTVSARFLARILGQCVSMTRAILPGKLLLRNAFRLLKTKSNWDDSLLLDCHTVQDLLWWHCSLHNWNGCPVVKAPIDCQMVTDASGLGWGAHLGAREACGVWDWYVRRRPSNTREMFAVLAGLKSFHSFVSGKHLEVLTDNISTVAYLNNLGGPSQELSELARAIWLTCHQFNIRLTVRHLSGAKNVWADALSRRASPHEWHLHPAVFRMVDSIWGPHTIDRFAGMANS
jgi:hypothetical protein